MRWHKAKNVDPAQDIVEVAGIRVLSAAATLCLLGTVAPKLVVEKCLDQFLRSESTRWLDATWGRLDSPTACGPRMLARVRQDERRVQGNTDSWLERVAAKLVALPWLPPMALRYEVETGGRVFRLDVACPELMLGIEVHSRSFHFGPGKEDSDNVRELMLAWEGRKILFVIYSQLRHPEEFVRQFSKAAKARAAQLGVCIPTQGQLSGPVGLEFVPDPVTCVRFEHSLGGMPAGSVPGKRQRTPTSARGGT